MYPQNELIYYLFLLLLLSIIVLFYIYYESYRRKRQNLAQGEIVGLWDKRERRRFRRLETALDIRYEILDSPKFIQKARTRDISQGGIGVIIYEKFKAGTPLRIWINLPDKKEPMFILGDLVWSREVFPKSDRRIFYAGIKFTSVDTTTQLQLFDFISSLDKKEYMKRNEVPIQDRGVLNYLSHFDTSLINKILLLSFVLHFSGCSLKFEKVKQTRPGEATGEIIINPSK